MYRPLLKLPADQVVIEQLHQINQHGVRIIGIQISAHLPDEIVERLVVFVAGFFLEILDREGVAFFEDHVYRYKKIRDRELAAFEHCAALQRRAEPALLALELLLWREPVMVGPAAFLAHDPTP